MKFSASAKRTFWWPVTVQSPDPDNPGKQKSETFKMLFEAILQDEALALDEEASKAVTEKARVDNERRRLIRVCLDWDDVFDEAGKVVLFDEVFDVFIQFPWNRLAIYRAYAEATSGESARLGN